MNRLETGSCAKQLIQLAHNGKGTLHAVPPLTSEAGGRTHRCGPLALTQRR